MLPCADPRPAPASVLVPPPKTPYEESVFVGASWKEAPIAFCFLWGKLLGKKFPPHPFQELSKKFIGKSLNFCALILSLLNAFVRVILSVAEPRAERGANGTECRLGSRTKSSAPLCFAQDDTDESVEPSKNQRSKAKTFTNNPFLKAFEGVRGDFSLVKFPRINSETDICAETHTF